MPSQRILIVHAGSMNNKGTQALLKSDVAVLRENLGADVNISVLTTDVEGVKKMGLPLEGVFSSVVDIPYEKADFSARRFGLERGGLSYKFFALSSLLTMFFQMTFSAFSAVLVKAGFDGFYRSEILKSVKNCDIVVSYSDENFKEAAAYLPLNIYWVLTWWSMLVSRTWDILVAKYFGKPVVMFPNSVGPFRTFVGRFLSKLALNSCSIVLVREPISYRIVESLGVSTPKVLTFDTTWIFDSADISPARVGSRRCIGASLGFYAHVFQEEEIEKQATAYAEAFDEAIRKFGCNVIFIPHYISGFRHDDLEVSRMIMRKMKSKDNVRIVEIETADEFKSFLSKMDLVVSAKMHPAVLALSRGVPTLCIAYDHKQIGLFEGLDMSECAVPIYEFSKEKLLSKIGYVWNNRETIRSRLALRVPLVQNNVKEAIGRALSLVKTSESDGFENAVVRTE